MRNCRQPSPSHQTQTLRLASRVQPDQTGQNLVEFALILSIMVGLMLGSFQVLLLTRQRGELDKVARQASRQAAELGGGQEEVYLYIDQQLQLLNGDGAADIDITYYIYKAPDFSHAGPDTQTLAVSDPSDFLYCDYGDYVGVEVRQDFTLIIPYLDRFFQGVDVAGEFRIEHMDRCWRGGA